MISGCFVTQPNLCPQHSVTFTQGIAIHPGLRGRALRRWAGWFA